MMTNEQLVKIDLICAARLIMDDGRNENELGAYELAAQHCAKFVLRNVSDPTPPLPAFRCGNCGKTGGLSGRFSQAVFERDKQRWDAIHKHCQPSIDGAGI